MNFSMFLNEPLTSAGAGAAPRGERVSFCTKLDWLVHCSSSSDASNLLNFSLGYTRIILAALSLHYMSTHPKYCTALYGISCLLDAVDGKAARWLGQESKFGAVLDMVTDRSAAAASRILAMKLTTCF